MAAVSQKIPNLLGGVSQQPDPVKLPGQVREANNVYLDPTFGCRKRPGTEIIGTMASDIPATAYWFNIFRDNNERYVGCIYGTTVRVWDLNNGIERTVNVSSDSAGYLSGNTNNLQALTIADYTLICNPSKRVSMSGDRSPAPESVGLVIVNQVSYNTTYSIDLNDTGTDPTLVKVYRATALSVSPGTYKRDNPSCEYAGNGTFNESQGTDKTGLNFKVTVQCQTYVEDFDDDGIADYDSRYTVSVQMLNGGSGWRVGDVVNVTVAGLSYAVTVTSEDFTLTYGGAGVASYTTDSNDDSGPLDIGAITAGLVTAVNAISSFTAVATGNVIKITSTKADFNLSVRGGSTNRAMTSIKGVAQDVAELPAQCFPGTIVKVANTEEADADDYYVKFEAAAQGIPGAGSWTETVAPDTLLGLNRSTMPQALIRESDGSFSMKPLGVGTAFDGWADREVGDEDSNPEPSFVGKAISNMFFFANRFGVLSEDSLVMSQPGDYFNFFTVSALTISDADPIDLTASSTKPAILKAAVPTAKGLVLFAERSQFLLKSEEIAFAASTVKLTEISNYFYRSNVLPMNTGVSIAFVSESATYAKVQEMAIDSVENRPVVAEITRVIPEYLPKDFTWEDVSPNNNMVFLGDSSENMYVFKFLNNGDERQMAGWTKWTYPVDIVNMASEDDILYLVGYDGTKHSLLKSKLVDDPEVAPVDVGFSKFSPRMDFKVTQAACTITDDPGALSTVTPPTEALVTTTADYMLIVVDGDYAGYFERVDVTSGSFQIKDTIASSNFIVGYAYDSEVQLPSIFVQAEGKADRVNVPQVSFMYLDLYYSGRYDVTVKKLGYPDTTKIIEVTPANSYDANEAPVVEIGVAEVPIFSAGNIVKVTIKAPDPYPSAITGYSWEGSYNNRGISPLK